MKKLSLIAMKRDADRLAGRLLRLSCVEVVRVGDPDPTMKLLDCSEEAARTDSERKRVTQAIRLLSEYDDSKKKLFPAREKITFEQIENGDETVRLALEAADKALAAEAKKKEILGKLSEGKLKRAMLEPWETYGLPLGVKGTESTVLRLGTLPASVDTEQLENGPFPLSVETVKEDKRVKYVSVLCAKKEEGEAFSYLSEKGFLPAGLPEMNGTVQEEKEALAADEEALLALDGEQTQTLRSLVPSLGTLKEASDLLETKLHGVSAKQKLLCTDETVMLSGWVPEGMEEKVGKELDRFDCSYEMTDPAPEDDPPTLLVNPKNFDPFEMIIGLYSLPAYGTFDPTFIMSIFYFIIFGMMLADAVYGLILVVCCFGALKLFDLQGGTKKLVKLFGICGISCMIWGVLFGSYFGDFPVVFAEKMLGMENVKSPAILFDPVADPISFLILSLAVGAVHLLVGMGIKAYVLIRTGKPWAALFDVGSWYILFAGIGLYFVSPAVGIAVAVLGALMLVLTQGREKKGIFGKISGGLLSLYDIVNYVSDLLSYSRIMALGMSSAVIASVLNIISTLKGPTVVGYIVMTVVVLFANVVNLAINLLGSFVHASRLQYIEFFGKFYEDGGRPFDPVAPSSEYTVIEEKEP